MERLFQTLQDRMVKAMRLQDISGIEAANAWLQGYLGQHNERFAVQPASLADAGWRPVWEGNRPGDRRADDKFHLYRRGRKADPASDLTDLGPASTEPDPTVPSRARTE